MLKPSRTLQLAALSMSLLPVWAAGIASQPAPSGAAEVKDTELEVIRVLARKPGGLELTTSQLLTVAGSGNDPLRALEALPGVVLATPGSGGPVAMPAVRGSSPLDNQYQLDDLPVGYVFHNDGLSTLNPLLISSFRLQSSSWTPQYQDAAGAVIVTRLREPSFEQPQLVLDAGAIRSAILAETPLGEQAAMYLSARRSFVHLYIDKFIEDEEFSFVTPPKITIIRASWSGSRMTITSCGCWPPARLTKSAGVMMRTAAMWPKIPIWPVATVIASVSVNTVCSGTIAA